MSPIEQYYAQRIELVEVRLARLQQNIDRAWARSAQPSNANAARLARAMQVAAAEAMAATLEEHARKLRIALAALHAECETGEER